MLKRVSLVRLRGDLSREECLRRWFGAHADVVRALPEVRGYTVDVVTDLPAGDDGWDALATLWFDDEAAMRRSLEDPEVGEALTRTRDDFAEAVRVMIVQEYRLLPETSSS
jgi:uncharacterized protein (TIGR02118 family)